MSLSQETPSELQTSIVIESEISGNYNCSFGDITIQFKRRFSSKHCGKFQKLARSGFYDGTIFHRIIPGFVIQGGDPNTISGSRDTWGQGGPGYSIDAEISNVKHVKKYIVSMARSADINSAGSQFYHCS